MQSNACYVPEVLYSDIADKHDLRHFTETVLEFAAAGGAFVYPILAKSAALVISPHPLNEHERHEIFKRHETEEVKDHMLDGLTPEDILAGRQCTGGYVFHYSLTPEELRAIAKELGIDSQVEAAAQAVATAA
jgi:hypothetical protein